MIDEYKIDGHKLIYHPERVSKWNNGETIYPIYAEISLTSACNHRCIFCAPNFFLQYKPVFIDTNRIKDTIGNMAKVGIKAIMFGGEGEPLLHPDIISIIEHTKNSGIDVALTTNGVLLNQIKLKQILPNLSWIKISVDAGSSSIYSKLHGTKKEDYQKVLNNISKASFLKRLKKYNCTIGIQSILLKENIGSLANLAKFLKYAKPDYFVVKPFSDHELRKGDNLENPTDEQIDSLLKEMELYKDNYEFIFRERAFCELEKCKNYDKCYAQDFVCYIDTLGGVHSCINFIDNPDYCYGNINEDSFENIWKNKKNIEPNLDKCRTICRLDNINRYLWELKNPPNHVNFI
jgi:MoaA/NifB/PqqE/SkfB family radical SAM enzyme